MVRLQPKHRYSWSNFIEKLLINEIAPRPHNSGHYTIEACAVSQYEAHLRAILDLPLVAEDLEADRAAVMLNILGGTEKYTHIKVANAALSISRAAIHLYGKGDGRPKRKMGHITVTAKHVDQAEKNIAPLVTLVDEARAETKKPKVISGIQSAFSSKKPADEIPKPFGGSIRPVVLVTMGSDSDLNILKPGIEILEDFGVPHRVTITSAHRTPDRMFEVAAKAESSGIKVIIAAAGGAAHLPGMIASKSSLPVIGVPVKASVLDGQDSLYSIVQMPVC